MYKVLIVLSAFIFHPAWSAINEKGPGQGVFGQGDVFIEPVSEIDWPGDISQAPTHAIIKFVKQGPGQVPWLKIVKGGEQSEWFVAPENEEEGPTFLISDFRPSGPMGIESTNNLDWPVHFAQAPTHAIIKFVKGPGQGALGVEEEGPTFMIEVAGIRSFTPVLLGPGSLPAL